MPQAVQAELPLHQILRRAIEQPITSLSTPCCTRLPKAASISVGVAALSTRSSSAKVRPAD
jgi:hypothetical protein